MSIPKTLRNVKVFHHQGTKHFRMMKQGSSRKTVRGAKKVSKHQTKKVGPLRFKKIRNKEIVNIGRKVRGAGIKKMGMKRTKVANRNKIT